MSFAHGHSGYTNFDCRCAICTDAQKMYMRELRARLRQTPFQDMEHGRLNTYANFGCRCDDCRAAYNQARKSWPSELRRTAKRKADKEAKK